MQISIHPARPTRSQRVCLLALAALVSWVLMAGCAASSHGPTVGAAGSNSTTPGAYGSGPLAFARCMRANGVPNFPDPAAGGGFQLNGIDPASPAFQAAQARCERLMAGGKVGGPLPVPGSTTHPSAQTLAKLLTISECMRRHGVPEFPDPRTSVPLHPFGSGTGVITNYDGAILLFPSALNMHAPAYEHAAAACGALARKLGSGPHG
jgi:hypothetical protein